MMTRLQAHEPSFRIERDKLEYDLLAIPEVTWKWWLWCHCRAGGRVVKTINTGSATYTVPVCNARVHICEVDRIPSLVARLPDSVVRRLADDLIRLIERPPPRPEKLRGPIVERIPLPVPPDPLPFDRAAEGLIPLAEREAAELLRASGVIAAARGPAMLGPQPEPPDMSLRMAQNISVPLTVRAALTAGSIEVVRDALIAQAEMVRIYICALEWLWPYLLHCDEVAVVTTDSHGRFEADIRYLCLGDHPDLYFWVEYPIDSAWQTVYRPSLACHTYWTYACGSEVTIRITDPRVPGCWDHPVLPGKKLVVKSIGPNVSMSDINRASVAAEAPYVGTGKAGELTHPYHPIWATKEVAFGGVLEPRVDFGSGLKTAGITHYLWSYRPVGSADENDWRPIEAEVRRHYRVATPPGDPIRYSSVRLGPDPQGVFEIEPALPADGEDWEVLSENYDLASAFFDSAAAIGPDATGHGMFELKLELFRKVGGVAQRVDLTAEGVDVAETTSQAPFLADEIYTAAPTSDRVLTQGVGGASHIVAYRLVLRVDNRPCFGTINDVTVAGTGAGPCGFLEYDRAAMPPPSAVISFRASHPGNFAAFGFATTRVTTYLPSASAHGLTQAAAVNGFARAGDTFGKTIPVATLLHELEGATSCVRAAFAETLRVYALVTNGYWRLSHLDAPRPAWEDPSQIGTRAFALTPTEPAP